MKARHASPVWTSLAVLAIAGCGKTAMPPKVLGIASERHPDAIDDCLMTPAGEALFPGMTYVPVGGGLPGRPEDNLYLSGGGIWILASIQVGGPQLEVRSDHPLSQAQIAFVKECAAGKSPV